MGALLLNKVFKKAISEIIERVQNWKPETKLLIQTKLPNFQKAGPGLGLF